MGKLRNYIGSIRQALNKMHIAKGDRLAVCLDILYCRIFLHCRLDEYCLYHFYKYSNLHRRKFILWHHKKTYYRKINPWRYSMHKKKFYQDIQMGMQREVLYMPECGEEAFLDFVKKHKKVIIKPDVGSCGRQICLHIYEDDDHSLQVFHSFQTEMICEEYIIQHKALSALNPSSVNSIRLIALWDEGDVQFLSATLKCGGSADAFVDNMHSNGIGANVDIETGVVTGCGRDYYGNTYIYHPVTAEKIVGFSVPYWQETLELTRKCHCEIPECPFIGWDVAITEKGPEIIEINSAPGPKIIQFMDEVPKGEILKQYIKKNHCNKRKKAAN